MNNTPKIEVLPEDKVVLTQEQKNLLELAFVKQIPPEDAKFIESVKNQTTENPFDKISEYFTSKYGQDFGVIYLSAITSGRDECAETIKFIENRRASERINKQKRD